MKLRLRENSIRLRLLQSEVKRLREMGNVSERITFGIGPTETLTYSLQTSADAEKISAQMMDNQLEVFLPIATAENWADTQLVGLYETQSIGEADELNISIEKDFVCLDRPADADNNDAFPHPKTEC